MRLIYGLSERLGHSAEFAREFLDQADPLVPAGASLVVASHQVLSREVAEALEAGSLSLVTLDGTIVEIEDMSDYGEDVLYIDVRSDSGLSRNFTAKGQPGYYAEGVRTVVRFAEYGTAFGDGTRKINVFEIWVDLDEDERPIVGTLQG